MVSSENVCGLIFDCRVAGGINAALGNETARGIFASGNVVELNTSKDIAKCGIDETVMFGLVKYHLTHFFTLAGENQRLFLSFMDSSVDTEYKAVELMQLAANGIIYQIGVWSAEFFASPTASGAYNIVDGGVLTKLQHQAEVLGGKIGVTNYEGNSPVNILVNAPTINAAVVDFSRLPGLSTLNLPKVSLLLGQASNDDVHAIQEKLGGLYPVGNIGAAMACLAVATAEMNIGHVEMFNLSSVMTTAELGFGNTTLDEETHKFVPAASFNNIKTLGYVDRNERLHRKGYIFLTNYDGIENGIFFSDDQTLSTGDYRSIARGRVMHKSRRVVRRALLPRVKSTVEVDASTGQLSDSTITEFENLIYAALDANMVRPGTWKPQISGREVVINSEQNILENDQLLIEYSLVPVGCVSSIFVTEGFASSISAS